MLELPPVAKMFPEVTTRFIPPEVAKPRSTEPLKSSELIVRFAKPGLVRSVLEVVSFTLSVACLAFNPHQRPGAEVHRHHRAAVGRVAAVRERSDAPIGERRKVGAVRIDHYPALNDPGGHGSERRRRGEFHLVLRGAEGRVALENQDPCVTDNVRSQARERQQTLRRASVIDLQRGGTKTHGQRSKGLRGIAHAVGRVIKSAIVNRERAARPQSVGNRRARVVHGESRSRVQGGGQACTASQRTRAGERERPAVKRE